MQAGNDIPGGPLKFTPLAPIGVEIDTDLAQPMDDDGREHFKRLFYRYGLVVLRGQHLTWDQQADVMRILGPVLNQDGKKTLDPEAYLGRNALSFHSDLSFGDHPYRALSLHALDVVGGATSTLFVDGVRAYQLLPERLRSKVQKLQARAMISLVDVGQVPEDVLPQVVRPAVIDHPVTGESILYVTEQHTVSLEGLPANQSDALLRELADHLYAADNLYTHHWHNGDIILWDNMRMQHARPRIPEGMPRRLQRVTGASRTFEQVCPAFTSSAELARLSAVNSYDVQVGRWTTYVSPQGKAEQRA